MKRLAFLLAAALLVGCSQIHHDKEPPKVRVGSAPAQVTAAFQKDHPSSMIKQVEKETYPNGTIHYEFTFIDSSGKQQTVEYSATGEQLPEH
jgi:hypothetical protein